MTQLTVGDRNHKVVDKNHTVEDNTATQFRTKTTQLRTKATLLRTTEYGISRIELCQDNKVEKTMQWPKEYGTTHAGGGG